MQIFIIPESKKKIIKEWVLVLLLVVNHYTTSYFKHKLPYHFKTYSLLNHISII